MKHHSSVYHKDDSNNNNSGGGTVGGNNTTNSSLVNCGSGGGVIGKCSSSTSGGGASSSGVRAITNIACNGINSSSGSSNDTGCLVDNNTTRQTAVVVITNNNNSYYNNSSNRTTCSSNNMSSGCSSTGSSSSIITGSSSIDNSGSSCVGSCSTTSSGSVDMTAGGGGSCCYYGGLSSFRTDILKIQQQQPTRLPTSAATTIDSNDIWIDSNNNSNSNLSINMEKRLLHNNENNNYQLYSQDREFIGRVDSEVSNGSSCGIRDLCSSGGTSDSSSSRLISNNSRSDGRGVGVNSGGVNNVPTTTTRISNIRKSIHTTTTSDSGSGNSDTSSSSSNIIANTTSSGSNGSTVSLYGNNGSSTSRATSTTSRNSTSSQLSVGGSSSGHNSGSSSSRYTATTYTSNSRYGGGNNSIVQQHNSSTTDSSVRVGTMNSFSSVLTSSTSGGGNGGVTGRTTTCFAGGGRSRTTKRATDEELSVGLQSLVLAGGDSGLTACRTNAQTERVEFVWEVAGWLALRKLAKLKSLPYKDRLLSPDFGRSSCGSWHLALFPYGDRATMRNVSLYLFGDKAAERIAEFSFCLLDADLNEIPGTRVNEDVTCFTATDCSWGWHEFLSVDDDAAMQSYLHDDVLRIKAEVDVLSGVRHGKTMPLDSNLFALRETPKCSAGGEVDDETECSFSGDVAVFSGDEASHDVRIVCGEQVRTASRFMLAARSVVMRAMLYGNFKESKSNTIEIFDCPNDVLDPLVDFINTDDCGLLCGATPDVEKILSLYAAADKYQLMGLRRRCEAVLARCINNNTVLDILQAAEDRGCNRLTNAVHHFYSHRGSAVELLKHIRSRLRPNSKQ
eukprot:GHVS01076913.1.p1 GENE.GHVS01076913.1~~GHVS01076913.1.p1  ORF type:complete len:843 (+),score=264.93 GHVS01076913.1:533-3061(+)